MIRLAEAAQLMPQLEARQTVCAARICTLHTAWAGISSRCGTPDFYRTEAGAVLAVLDSLCTLDGEDFEPHELTAFLQMRGCSTLVCSALAAQRLGLDAATACPVLRRTGAHALSGSEHVCLSPPLPQVYRLLMDTFENMQSVQFNAWYADISLKIRRGTALLAGVLEDGALAATAGIYHQNACTAVLGSVATRPQSRGNGYASLLVNALAAHAGAQGRTALIVAMNPHAQALYERLGFCAVDELCEVRLRDTAPGAVRTE